MKGFYSRDLNLYCPTTVDVLISVKVVNLLKVDKVLQMRAVASAAPRDPILCARLTQFCIFLASESLTSALFGQL